MVTDSLKERDELVCPVCLEWILTNNDGTLRRHKGKTAFDLETDGICSGSNCLPDLPK